MSDIIDKLINNISNNSSVSNDRLELEVKNFGFEVPDAYLEFMKMTNGGTININDVYFELWPIEKLLELNEGYKVEEFAHGYLVIGTNGGGTAYAINKKTKEFVQFEFIGMLIEDEPILLGEDFDEFIKILLEESPY